MTRTALIVAPDPDHLQAVRTDVESARRLVNRLRAEAAAARARAALASESTARAKERAAALGARYEGRREGSSAAL